MIDGGLLDNKPFTYVTKAIETKPADHEVYRVVAYVEPDPEGDVSQSTDGPPKGLFAQIGSLYKLSRHEPILADLRALQTRNEKVERLKDIRIANFEDARHAAQAAGAERDLSWPPTIEQLEQWRSATNAAAAKHRGTGYSGYVVLKARRAASVMAAAICQALNYPYHSRHAYFVRRLVRDWLRKQGAFNAPEYVEGQGYQLAATQKDLLRAFDLPFRLRRVRALVQALNHSGYEGASTADRTRLDAGKRALSDIAFAYESASLDHEEIRRRVVTALGFDDADALAAAVSDPDFDLESIPTNADAALRGTYTTLLEHFSAAGQDKNQRIAAAIADLPDAVRDAVTIELAAFPFLDMTLYPSMDAAEVTDLISVRTMRISPRDATLLSNDPLRLKSRCQGAFRGFLERAARENDLLWGRLDGVERLVDVIVTASTKGGMTDADREALRRDFTKRAMTEVLDQENARPDTQISQTIAGLRKDLQQV
jgi:patatin-related protein